MANEISRRSLAGIAAAAALAAQTPQSPPKQDALPANAEEELTAARNQNRTNAALIAKVKLPMDVEPAAHFKAQ